MVAWPQTASLGVMVQTGLDIEPARRSSGVINLRYLYEWRNSARYRGYNMQW